MAVAEVVVIVQHLRPAVSSCDLPDGNERAEGTSGGQPLGHQHLAALDLIGAHINTQGRPAGVLPPGSPGGSTKIMLFSGEAGGSSNGLANTEVFDTANSGAGRVDSALVLPSRSGASAQGR